LFFWCFIRREYIADIMLQFHAPNEVNLNAMTADKVRARVAEIGIVPAVRADSAEDALFAVEAILRGGIHVVELTATTPGAPDVIRKVSESHPDLMIGGGSILDLDTACRFLASGAAFLTSPGLDLEVVEFAAREDVLNIPGALTPSEVMAANRAGADLIKLFPCAPVGGPGYVKAMRAPFPHVSFIAAGGVQPQTAMDYIRAGAVALGVGGYLVPAEAIRRRNAGWIRELCGRFLGFVREARAIGTAQAQTV
jgi:2-dehydro-3-deoxyphosphogluconate aldolase / (4S)-4-hydroxy-2-oxoglutarate aldolase